MASKLEFLIQTCSIYTDLDVDKLRILVRSAGIEKIDGILVKDATKDKLCAALSQELENARLERNSLLNPDARKVNIDIVAPEGIISRFNINPSILKSEYVNGILRINSYHGKSLSEPIIIHGDHTTPPIFDKIYNIMHKYVETDILTEKDLEYLQENKSFLDYLAIDMPGIETQAYVKGFIRTKSYDTPEPIQGLLSTDSISISCGALHMAILTHRGQVYTFGSNVHGQLGLGDRKERGSPVLLSGLPHCSAISCGYEYTAVLTQEGQVYMFGDNSYGQSGVGTREEKIIVPILISDLPPCSTISCGYFHTAAITRDGQVYVFGLNDRGQLGLGGGKKRRSPVLLTGLPPCSVVSCGFAHTIALTREGQVYVFGYNSSGQLGLGDTENRRVPTLLLDIPPCVGVSCGNGHTALLTREGLVYMFGINGDGQLGLGDTSNRLLPTLLEDLPLCSVVSCGCRHTTILTRNGQVYTFGNKNEMTPTLIKDLRPCISISSGCYNTGFICVS